MRFGPDDSFWLVVDPTAKSELADVLCETTLRRLELQLKGGLTMDESPTIFTEREEAEREAQGRLLALRAAQALGRRVAEGGRIEKAHRVALLDEDGRVILEAKVP